MSQHRKILIVDDEPDMRIFLSVLSKTNGYIPFVARNGSEGMKQIKEICPDLIFLDIMMPGEGGIRMYQSIRTDADLCLTPIIMLSAVKKGTFLHYLAMLNSQLETNIPEPDRYLEKPPEPEVILQTIRSVLNET
ncbi:MAG: response regulator [Candidatus Magnetomorum sp.]|nr:response regulator [Candidatus Magnetomorum sp.]